MAKPRKVKPTRQFLGAHNLRKSPPLQCPTVADEPEIIERIAAATSTRYEPEHPSQAWLEDWEEVRQLHRSQQHALDVATMQEIRPSLELEDRIKDIQRRAKQAGFDLKRETALMRRDIDRAKAADRKPPARVLTRCEGLEALLDGTDTRKAA